MDHNRHTLPEWSDSIFERLRNTVNAERMRRQQLWLAEHGFDNVYLDGREE